MIYIRNDIHSSRSVYHLEQQATSISGLVDCGSRIHGTQPSHSGSYMASAPTRRSGRVYQGGNDDNGGQPRCNSDRTVFHRRTKHIQICYHHVREAVAEGIVRHMYYPTKEMLADIFTKALERDQFEHLRDKLGLQKLRL